MLNVLFVVLMFCVLWPSGPEPRLTGNSVVQCSSCNKISLATTVNAAKWIDLSVGREQMRGTQSERARFFFHQADVRRILAETIPQAHSPLTGLDTATEELRTVVVHTQF